MIFIALLIIQLGVFAGLIFILKNVLQKHLGVATSQVDRLAQESEAKLAEAKKRSEDALLYYDETVKKSKAEGERLKQQLIDEGLKTKQELLEQARKQSEEIVDRAKAASELIEEDLNLRISEAAKKISLEAIRQIFNDGINEELHAKWVQGLLEGDFDGLSRLNLPDKHPNIEIYSAFPLTSQQKSRISKVLTEKTGRSFEIKEHVDSELIFGIRLVVGSIVLDGSFASKLKGAIQHVRAK